MQDHVSFDLMLKATPATEGDNRIIYFEASNEGIDRQGERVLAKALEDSAPMFRAHGNIDIDHLSLLRKGTTEGIEAEIGFPVDVNISDKRTFVKAQLFAGESRLAKNANMVWESLTQLSPPARWYPSIGGSVLARSKQIDPLTKAEVNTVDRVRWTNVALSRIPVNHHIGQVGTAPIGTFCKSLDCFVLEKALEAGYGTDSASLTGGAALRTQSLDGAPVSYEDFEEHVARKLRRSKHKKALAGRDGNFADTQILKSIADFAGHSLGLQPIDALVMSARFLSDLKRRVSHDNRI
jgi:hypothetical protein